MASQSDHSTSEQPISNPIEGQAKEIMMSSPPAADPASTSIQKQPASEQKPPGDECDSTPALVPEQARPEREASTKGIPTSTNAALNNDNEEEGILSVDKAGDVDEETENNDKTIIVDNVNITEDSENTDDAAVDGGASANEKNVHGTLQSTNHPDIVGVIAATASTAAATAASSASTASTISAVVGGPGINSEETTSTTTAAQANNEMNEDDGDVDENDEGNDDGKDDMSVDGNHDIDKTTSNTVDIEIEHEGHQNVHNMEPSAERVAEEEIKQAVVATIPAVKAVEESTPVSRPSLEKEATPVANSADMNGEDQANDKGDVSMEETCDIDEAPETTEEIVGKGAERNVDDAKEADDVGDSAYEKDTDEKKDDDENIHADADNITGSQPVEAPVRAEVTTLTAKQSEPKASASAEEAPSVSASVSEKIAATTPTPNGTNVEMNDKDENEGPENMSIDENDDADKADEANDKTSGDSVEESNGDAIKPSETNDEILPDSNEKSDTSAAKAGENNAKPFRTRGKKHPKEHPKEHRNKKSKGRGSGVDDDTEEIIAEPTPLEIRQERTKKTFISTNPNIDTGKLQLWPWSDWNEWLQMRYFLRSNQPIAAQRLLLVFAMRRRSEIPIAMSASVNLLSIMMKVRSETHDVQSCRLGLAMAIIRLVNGMTDTLQPYEIDQLTQSVANSANVLKIPPTLVDIRHEATHGELPGLEALFVGAKKALEWLDFRYWQPQYKQLCDMGWFEPKTQRSKRSAKERKENKTGKKFEQGLMKELPKGMEEKPKQSKDDSVSEQTCLLNQIGLVINKKKARASRVARLRALDQRVADRAKVLASSSTGIWSECGDELKWQHTAIGLVVDQEHASRVPFEALLEEGSKTGGDDRKAGVSEEQQQKKNNGAKQAVNNEKESTAGSQQGVGSSNNGGGATVVGMPYKSAKELESDLDRFRMADEAEMVNLEMLRLHRLFKI